MASIESVTLEVAASAKKDNGPATRQIDEIVLLLGVVDVAASKRFYVDRGLAVAKSPLPTPGTQHCQGLLDPPYARLGLRALDSEHVLPLAAAGQAVVGGAGERGGVQGAGEVRGLGHGAGLGIVCGAT